MVTVTTMATHILTRIHMIMVTTIIMMMSISTKAGGAGGIC